MSRLTRLFGIGCAMIAGAGLFAANSEPLEATKQELRTFDRRRPNESPNATEGLRPNMPAIQAPGQDALPGIQSADPEKAEKERKRRKDAQKNWLVNGVEQLEKSEMQKEAGGSGSAEEIEGESAGAATDDDPQYLLKLYDQQKKGQDARKAEKPAQRAPRSDPFAPFLQDWLGTSPVRGQFFDRFVRNEPTTAAAGGDNSSGVTHAIANRDPFGVNQPAEPGLSESEPQPNPYLVPSIAPSFSQPGRNHDLLQNPTGPVVNVPPGQSSIPPALAPSDNRPPERKPPPPPLADERKYFPQLKKF